MRQVRLIFTTEEEWRNPALLTAYLPGAEYLGAKRRRGKEKGRGFRGRDSVRCREKKKEDEEETKKKI